MMETQRLHMAAVTQHLLPRRPRATLLRFASSCLSQESLSRGCRRHVDAAASFRAKSARPENEEAPRRNAPARLPTPRRSTFAARAARHSPPVRTTRPETPARHAHDSRRSKPQVREAAILVTQQERTARSNARQQMPPSFQQQLRGSCASRGVTPRLNHGNGIAELIRWPGSFVERRIRARSGALNGRRPVCRLPVMRTMMQHERQRRVHAKYNAQIRR